MVTVKLKLWRDQFGLLRNAGLLSPILSSSWSVTRVEEAACRGKRQEDLHADIKLHADEVLY